MKTSQKIILICSAAAIMLIGKLSAQTPASLVQTDVVQGSVTTCQTHAGISTFCMGTDGFVFSVLGAKYGPNLANQSAAGVASWNGLTGVVTYTPPVTSVQGKTGAVTIAATTSLQ